MSVAMGLSEQPANAGVVVGIDSFRTVEQRQADIIRNTTALQEAALEDMTEEGHAFMASLIEQIGADLSYCRRLFQKEVLTGS